MTSPPATARVRAGALHAEGLREYSAGRPARALQLYRRALAATGPGAEEPDARAGRIWLSVALSVAELHRPTEALNALAHAERSAAGSGDAALGVLVQAQRGLLLMRWGQPRQALVELNAAVGRRGLTSALDQFRMLLNRGYVYLSLHELGAARRDLQQAAAVAAANDIRFGEHKVRHNLGYLEFLLGNLPGALRLIEENMASADDDMLAGVMLLDRARVLVEAGLIRDADESLVEVSKILAHDRLIQELAETELIRAECALLAGDSSAARTLALRARTRFARRANSRWVHAAELVVLQADFVRDRGPARLAVRAAELSAQLADDGSDGPARMAALMSAQAMIGRGRIDDARAALAGAGGVRRGDPIGVRLHGRYVSALLAASTGERAAASRAIRRGQDELVAYRARFGSIDLQTASAIHGRRLADLDLSLALETGRAGRVFAAAERARAVSSRLPTVRPPRDEQTAALLSELRITVEMMRSGSTAALAARRRELERLINARAWTVPSEGEVRRPVGLPDLRVRLADADTTLAYYLRSGSTLYAVAVDGRGARLHTIGAAAPLEEMVRRIRADLDVLAQRAIPGALRSVAAGSLARTLKTLDGELLAGLGIGEQRLLVVPTGSLGALAWSLLPSRRSVPVVVAPSATAWSRSVSARPSGPVTVTAICGPGLRRAGSEVSAVRKAWHDAAVYTDDGATCAALSDALTRSTVVHIAAHGRHQTENPLFSSLRLADGPLFAHELDRTARFAEHVVLSACELGLATIRPGDEALGLTSVLLNLGARSVVAGVARVGDDAAEAAMQHYHHRLAAGRDSASALADALAEGEEDEPVPLLCFGGAWQPDEQAVG